MTEPLQPGPHLDADLLAAFAEDALTPVEREACVLHLAGCAACREVLFVAQAADEPAVPVPAPVAFMPTPLWRRLAPAAVATALAACLLTAFLVLRPKPPAATPDVARLSPVAPQSGSSLNEPPPFQQAVVPKPQPERATHRPASETRHATATPQGTPSSSTANNAAAATSTTVADQVADQVAAAPAPAGTGTALGRGIPALPLEGRSHLRDLSPAPQAANAYNYAAGTVRERNSAPPPASGPIALRIEPNQATIGNLARIGGAVLDGSGAAIAGATVTLRPPAGAVLQQAKTDDHGNFSLAGVSPGHYDLQIDAPGFLTVRQSLDLHGSDLALLTSHLPIGGSNQTVTVEAAAPMLETSNATFASAEIANLPENVALGKRRLALGPDGAVLLSTDEGRHWKKVKPVWTGKIVHIAANGQEFEIATDANAIWRSKDGKHWRQR